MVVGFMFTTALHGSCDLVSKVPILTQSSVGSQTHWDNNTETQQQCRLHLMLSPTQEQSEHGTTLWTCIRSHLHAFCCSPPIPKIDLLPDWLSPHHLPILRNTTSMLACVYCARLSSAGGNWKLFEKRLDFVLLDTRSMELELVAFVDLQCFKQYQHF